MNRYNSSSSSSSSSSSIQRYCNYYNKPGGCKITSSQCNNGLHICGHCRSPGHGRPDCKLRTPTKEHTSNNNNNNNNNNGSSRKRPLHVTKRTNGSNGAITSNDAPGGASSQQ